MRHAALPPLAAVVLSLLAACGGGGGGDPVTPTPNPTGGGAAAPRDSVFMLGIAAFSPDSVTIRVGQSVAWVFPREAHNVIFTRLPNGQANPLDILPTTNQVVTRKFDAAGAFAYDCTLHPGMRGKVVVTP